MESRAGTTFGKYRITALLGRGGMGEVYEAYDTSKCRAVALKILSDQYSHDERFRARFERESHAAAKLQEPHVIPIHDWGELNGSFYIDMRFVDGATLQQLLLQGPLEPSRATAITNQIAAALDAAHADGLIHRDVKPANIIVTPADFAYLLDFGIAEAKGDTHLTMTGTQIGSFAYMAPERFDDRPATPAVDVYSLACVLYEALTGHTPYPSNSMEQVIAGHLSQPPPRPSAVNPRVPASFDDVITRGMAKQPDDRYGSAGAFGRAAQRALRENWQTAPEASTMLGPQAVMPTLNYPSTGPQPWPSTGPMRMPPPPLQPQAGGPRWLVPTVIAVAAALVLGAVGLVIGLLATRSSGPSEGPARPTTYAAPPRYGGDQDSPPGPPPRRAPGSPLPPPVLGPDQSSSHEVCDNGFSLGPDNEWGSHSRRGTVETSCFFARSVLNAYWQTGNASQERRTVSAPGAVPCTGIRGGCDGTDFIMECEVKGNDSFITCTGGRNAIVYLY